MSPRSPRGLARYGTVLPGPVRAPGLVLALALVLAGPSAGQSTASRQPPPESALMLRDRGFAELENEHPQDAEATYRKLIEAVPHDPLGHANLAIALLRQQRYDDALLAIDAALATTDKAAGDQADGDQAGKRGKLLAIRGDVLQWQGQVDTALTAYQQAAELAPDDPEILFQLHQHATNIGNEEAAYGALDSLARLRPENVVVLLELADRAVARGERTAASQALLRLEELLWQGSDLANRAMGMVRTALEGDDLAKAQSPVKRLANVLKVSPMFRESLRELRTGILGIPLERFQNEPSSRQFGKTLPVRFVGHQLAADANQGGALVVADFDGDQRPDIARVRAGSGGQSVDTLEVRLASAAWEIGAEHPAPGSHVLHAIDIDNDGALDLVATSDDAPGHAFKGNGQGGFDPAGFGEQAAGLKDVRAGALVSVDFDIEGDLDLAAIGPNGAVLLRNNLEGPLEAVSAQALPSSALGAEIGAAGGIRASDLDRDGDLDLIIGHSEGLTWLDNLRQGRFVDRSADAGLHDAGRISDVVSADLDHDGQPDLVTAGRGLRAWQNQGGRFVPWTLLGLPASEETRSVIAFDADNDGRPDLAAVSPKAGSSSGSTKAAGGPKVFAQAASGRFIARRITDGPDTAERIAAADLDGDGDLDLVTVGAAGLHRLINEGGNENNHLSLRLRGLTKGNSKNNVFGIGSLIEVRDGRAYQLHEAHDDVVHIGLGDRPTADVLRVVWTNGVPQNRLAVAAEQTIVEEQLLKGSCPFLYVWDGEEIRFVTDLLWGAPIGLPVAPGVYAGSDSDELVRVDGAVPRDGHYDLRITEELWEAAFFDHTRLWIVDHPADVTVASNLRIVPGRGPVEAKVLATRDLRPVVHAIDGRGDDVTALVRSRDEVYADGYTPSPYQGVASQPWTFTFDLGTAPAAPIRLLLDGWIFPSDASLNLAVAQRHDLPDLPPRLEVETPDGWQVLIPSMGFPAGKTKMTVVDTPALPAGAHRLRMVTNRWLHWDRIQWSTAPTDGTPTVVAKLLPHHAELAYRGFSALERHAPNGPHRFAYAEVSSESPWLPFPGRYTRFGDVRPLLASVDDRSVILAPGDEMRLLFDARDLPAPAPGMVRTVFLESHGWDKDADRNTGAGERMEPLPFRAMTSYPYGPNERFPETPEHRDYRASWLTREVGAREVEANEVGTAPTAER